MSQSFRTDRRDSNIAYLQERRRLYMAKLEAQIAEAQHATALDVLDIDYELQRIDEAEAPRHEATLEELTRATTRCQQYEAQIANITQMCGAASGSRDPVAEVMRPIVEGMLLPMLTVQLEQAEQYRADIQRELEEEKQA